MEVPYLQTFGVYCSELSLLHCFLYSAVSEDTKFALLVIMFAGAGDYEMGCWERCVLDWF